MPNNISRGLQLGFGIQPLNPVPVDTWSGPYTGTTDQDGIDNVNLSIPLEVRFQSMEVRLIISGISRKFWYKDGIQDNDLVEFLSGGVISATGTNGTSGTSGINGLIGLSGTSGSNGTSGINGIDGPISGTYLDPNTIIIATYYGQLYFASDGTIWSWSGEGWALETNLQGLSGTSGIDGLSGTSGIDGIIGTSGTSGINGEFLTIMTQAQRESINLPTTGSVVYQTDGVEGVYVKTSTTWKMLLTSTEVPVQTFQQNLIPLNTSGNYAPTGITLSYTPFNLSSISVIVGGLAVSEGYGTRDGFDCYFSNDGGLTAKTIAGLVAGDQLYWNGITSVYDLTPGDLIDLEYDRSSLD